jgi:hypothetical protein
VHATCGIDWAEDHVRHEALEVERGKTFDSWSSQRLGEAEGSLSRETPGRVGAALTTPGRASTARWRGFGQRDGKVHARNQCLTPLNGPPAQIWQMWAGHGAHLLSSDGGELLGRHVITGREATVNVCGVTVAMPQG